MTVTQAVRALVLSTADKATLQRYARSRTMSHRTVLAAKALLFANEGVANNEIARRVGVNPNSVRSWRQRFEQEGMGSLGRIAPGRRRKPSLPEGTVAEVVRLIMNELPADGSTHWSTRSLGKVVGISNTTVAQIWRDHGLAPWKVDSFKVSTGRTLHQWSLLERCAHPLNPSTPVVGHAEGLIRVTLNLRRWVKPISFVSS